MVDAWKFMFGAHRHWEAVGAAGLVEYFEEYSGSFGFLPGSDANNGVVGPTMWTDEEWWEFIVYEERLSSTEYRKRQWRRELTLNDVITGPSSSATWFSKYGGLSTGATVPTSDQATKIELGINRNDAMGSGNQQHWFWGPWEILDGDVIADPYGIASSML